MKFDYLIVGQGLAGSVLAFYLLERNCRVLVIDDPNLPKSSTVAAGIYNPFTGRKLVKTWMADTLFALIERFYDKMQQRLEAKFLHNMPMYRPFLSQLEQNEWVAKSGDPNYSRYIANLVAPSGALPGIINPLGGMMLDKCGFLDIGLLIKCMRNYLLANNLLKLEHFDETCLLVEKNHVGYQDIQAKRIVFCNGAFLSKSKLFGWLPLRPVKGEILTVELKEPLDYMVNRGVFVLPVGSGRYKVGATFDNKDLSSAPTEKAREQLIHKLEKLINIPYRIKDQVTGIRPATADRRPFIGLHPKFEPLAVFNGLGTKGVSLAPFLAMEFFEFLQQRRPLIPEVAITRHFSLYYNKF